MLNAPHVKALIVPRWNVNQTTLRTRLATVSEEQQRFEEAARLWASLFVGDRKYYRVAPEFEASITEQHCAQVELLLDRLIYGTATSDTMEPGSFIPTVREARLLLTAAWLHPLGLMWGLFPVEQEPGTTPNDRWTAKPCPEKQLRSLGTRYHERTHQFLRENWRTFHNWSEEDLALLAKLCRAQRPGVELKPLPVAADTHDANRKPDSVYLRKLAGLLRLAQVCRIQPGYCPLDLANRLKPSDLPGAEDSYLGIVDLVAGVEFEHGSHAVVIEAVFPEKVDLEQKSTAGDLNAPLTIDARPALEYLRSKLAEIIDEVSPLLMKCASTRIDRVRLDLLTPSSRGTAPPIVSADEFFHHTWALHLAATTCATEVACSVGLVLDGMLSDELTGRTNPGSAPLVGRLEQRFELVEKILPFNLLTHRLIEQLRREISTMPAAGSVTGPKVGQVRELYDHVRGFLADRLDQCQRCGDLAAPWSKKYSMLDAIVLYEFSRSVRSFVKKLVKAGFRGRVLCVPVAPRLRRPEAEFIDRMGNQHVPETGEDARLEDWLVEIGLKAEFTSVEALSAELRGITRTGAQVAFFVGTRAVLCSAKGVPQACYSTVGNQVIALAVKVAGGLVFVIADAGKKATIAERNALEVSFDSDTDQAGQSYGHVDRLNLAGKDAVISGFLIPDKQ